MESAIATTIKQALCACTTADEVHKVADQYRAEVKAMHNDPEQRVFAIQIANLKAYQLNWME